jgi:hypothetical protein
MGAAIGTAVFGAVLASRLSSYLAVQLAGAPAGSPGRGALDTNNVQAIQQLPEPLKHLVLTAFAHALDDVFLACVPVIVLAFVVALFLKEVPLRTGPGRGMAAPAAPAPARQ